jgi:hypothetical protein
VFGIIKLKSHIHQAATKPPPPGKKTMFGMIKFNFNIHQTGIKPPGKKKCV